MVQPAKYLEGHDELVGDPDDSIVCDGPLDGYYLKKRVPEEKGMLRPMAADFIDTQHKAWADAVAWLTSPLPGSKRVYSLKHMTHHRILSIERDSLGQVTTRF